MYEAIETQENSIEHIVNLISTYDAKLVYKHTYDILIKIEEFKKICDALHARSDIISKENNEYPYESPYDAAVNDVATRIR